MYVIFGSKGRVYDEMCLYLKMSASKYSELGCFDTPMRELLIQETTLNFLIRDASYEAITL